MLVCKQTPRKNVQLVNRSSENTAIVFNIILHCGRAALLSCSSTNVERVTGLKTMMLGENVFIYQTKGRVFHQISNTEK